MQDIRAAYNLARRNGLVDKNPVADVRLLRENNKRVREVTPEEETAILAALEPTGRRFHTDLRPLVCFLTLTGLRLGEACGLKWGDVDFRAEVATLTKTKAGKVQHIPLSVEALGILRDIGPGDGGGFVFGWPDGRRWTSGYLTHAFHKAAIKAGVADVHVRPAAYGGLSVAAGGRGHLHREQAPAACFRGHVRAIRALVAGGSEGCCRAEHRERT